MNSRVVYALGWLLMLAGMASFLLLLARTESRWLCALAFLVMLGGAVIAAGKPLEGKP